MSQRHDTCPLTAVLAAGALPQEGFVRQEDIPLEAFLANRFGRWYAGEADVRHIA